MIHIPIKFNDSDDGEPQPPLDDHTAVDLSLMRAEQEYWRETTIRTRLNYIRRVRRFIVDYAADLVRSQSPQHEEAAAEILASQIIPLADACRFLERKADGILKPRRLGVLGRPAWLGRATAEVRREPYGVVLIIGPSNYPLFLMGVSLVQALTAGNAVLLKPAPGCSDAARLLRNICYAAGVPHNLIHVLPEEVPAVRSAIAAGVDKVLFTGSARTGRAILSDLAPRLIPATLELSGSDAMFVRADADLTLAARAIAFGLTLNRGATCIAPRRVFVHHSVSAAFECEILNAMDERETWQIEREKASTLAHLAVRAAAAGARLIVGEVDHHGSVTAPLIFAEARAEMAIMREDHFGAATAIVSVANDEEALGLNAACPYALGATIFSRDITCARHLAERIRAGSVVINDVIVPTADPRLPFGGRGESGYGVMRGAEGLLELTAAKVISVQRGGTRRHLDRPSAGHAEFLAQWLQFSHALSVKQRFTAAWRLIRAARGAKRS